MDSITIFPQHSILLYVIYLVVIEEAMFDDLFIVAQSSHDSIWQQTDQQGAVILWLLQISAHAHPHSSCLVYLQKQWDKSVRLLPG